MLAVDGLQPDVGHEVLWVLRDCLSGEVLLAKSLLSATIADLTALLTEVRDALPASIRGVVSDGQDAIRKAVARTFPDVPHQQCHFHYLREAARPIYEADRHAKKELKKRVRGVRKIERQSEDDDDGIAEVVRGYCAAVRAALTDDGRPPLAASGLKLLDRLEQIVASLDRVAARAGPLPGGLKRLRQLLSKGLEQTAALGPGVRGAYRWVKRVARLLANEPQALGPADTAATVEDPQSDATGGGDDPCAGVGEPATALREGVEELLVGTVRLLGVGGTAADEQRPGTLVRQPPLPRTSCQWPESGVAGAGRVGFGARALWLGDPVASGGRLGLGRRLRRTLAAVASRLGETSSDATATTTLPTRPDHVPEATGGIGTPAEFATLVFFGTIPRETLPLSNFFPACWIPFLRKASLRKLRRRGYKYEIVYASFWPDTAQPLSERL